MGIEELGIGAAALVAIPTLWKLIDKLLNEFFRSSRNLQESDKSSRITIDNHIDHNTAALNELIISNTVLIDLNKIVLVEMKERHEEATESRRNLIKSITKSTEASTTQTITNSQLVKAVENLEQVVRDKL
jgi:hypothetical protein